MYTIFYFISVSTDNVVSWFLRVTWFQIKEHSPLASRRLQIMSTRKGWSSASTVMLGMLAIQFIIKITLICSHTVATKLFIGPRKLEFVNMIKWQCTETNWHHAMNCRTRTCSNKMPGSLDHEEQDVKTFASWVLPLIYNYLPDGSCQTNTDTINPDVLVILAFSSPGSWLSEVRQLQRCWQER